MYAGILTVSVFGLVVNTALVRLERRFSRWRVTPGQLTSPSTDRTHP